MSQSMSTNGEPASRAAAFVARQIEAARARAEAGESTPRYRRIPVPPSAADQDTSPEERARAFHAMMERNFLADAIHTSPVNQSRRHAQPLRGAARTRALAAAGVIELTRARREQRARR